jgi:hypothetical protein
MEAKNIYGNIEMDFRKMGVKGLHWIDLAIIGSKGWILQTRY